MEPNKSGRGWGVGGCVREGAKRCVSVLGKKVVSKKKKRERENEKIEKEEADPGT